MSKGHRKNYCSFVSFVLLNSVFVRFIHSLFFFFIIRAVNKLITLIYCLYAFTISHVQHVDFQYFDRPSGQFMRKMFCWKNNGWQKKINMDEKFYTKLRKVYMYFFFHVWYIMVVVMREVWHRGKFYLDNMVYENVF